MITFIFKAPFFILYVIGYSLYLIITKEYIRILNENNGSMDELMKVYGVRIKKGFVRLDGMIPYFWAVIMLIVSFFIFKNNIS